MKDYYSNAIGWQLDELYDIAVEVSQVKRVFPFRRGCFIGDARLLQNIVYTDL